MATPSSRSYRGRERQLPCAQDRRHPKRPSFAGAVETPRLPGRAARPSIGRHARLGELHGIRRFDLFHRLFDQPAGLGVAMEERGFDSVWAAEHSHIPVPRRTRADSELGKRDYDVMDPFVTLAAAACATKRLKIATGITLVIQRDTIQTAKLVASIDQVSGRRFVFGI